MTSIRYRHFTLEQYEAKVEARFWSRVNKTETCWLWTGRLSAKGYGAYSYTEYQSGRSKEGAKHHSVPAHRYAWEKDNGPMPKAMSEMDHICHTPACVRPSHLRPVTSKQNNENRAGATVRSKSGVRGVHWVAAKKRWCGTVGHNYKKIHVGYFRELADAEAAVIAKRNELFTHNNVDRQR